MKRLAHVLLGALTILAAEPSLPSARAQDDWAIKREAPAKSTRSPAPAQPGLRALQNALADPDDELAFERLVASRRAEPGGLAALEQELTERMRVSRATSPALVLARLLVLEGRWEDASALLSRVLAEHADALDVRLFRARLSRLHASRDDARADFAFLLARPSRATTAQRQQALRALAELALEEQELDQARAYYRELGAMRSDGWRDEREFPRALAKFGRHAEAARAYHELLPRVAATRDRALLVLELAHSELAAGQLEAALASLERARKFDATLEPEVRQAETDTLRRAGRLAEAAQRREREAQAGHPSAWRDAAAIWQELADSARAVRCLRAQLVRKPDDVAARADLAALLEGASDVAGAELEYRRLLRAAPANPAFVVSLAELLAASGRRVEALALAGRSAAKQPRSAPLHVALRDLYARWGEHRLADQELALLTSLEPQNPSHSVALAERALAAGKRSAALELFTKLYPGRDAASQSELARILEQHDLIAEAVTHARRALELVPGDASSQQLLASLLERAARGADAESAWQTLLDNPAADEALRREARRHLAVLWRRSGRLAQRTSELEAELREHPDDLARVRLLAELYAREPAHADKRIALLELVLTKRPGDSEALLALEQAELERGAVGAGLRASLRQLEGIDPNAASGAERVAHALELARRYVRDVESPALVARALLLRPHDAQTFASAGAFYAQRAEWELARAAYERAAQLDPLAFTARYALAREALRRGDVMSARTKLQEVIAGATDDALVADALSLFGGQEGEAADSWLLERAVANPERAVLRRFVLERELLPSFALAQRVLAGEASQTEHEQLAKRVSTLRSLLLAALRGQTATERMLVLPFLAAAPHSAGLEALLGLAERDDRSLQERAGALTALGRMQDPAASARLRALATGSNRRLRPLALWALSESTADGAVATLRTALEQRDEAISATAVVLAGQRRELSLVPRLRALAADARDVVRAAALWSLARTEPDVRYDEAWARLRSGSSELVPVALAHTPEYAAEGLLSSDRRLRRAALELLRVELVSASAEVFDTQAAQETAAAPPGAVPERAPARLAPRSEHDDARRPIPAWPFDVRRYLAHVSRASARFPGEAPEHHDVLIARAAARLLQGSPAQALEALEALVPDVDGLTLRAFVEANVCRSPEQGRALAEHVREPLVTLAGGPHPALRERALALLIESGGSEHPEVRRALATGDPAQVRALLVAADDLAANAGLPAALRAAIVPLLDDPSWPIRMHAARALRHAQTLPQLAHDPIALVRASGRNPAAIQRCPAPRPGAVN